MIYTVTFNPALDYVMYLPFLLPGETNRARGEELQAGGKGVNVSYILSQLGQPNVALGFLAGDTGELLRQRINRMGIRSDFISLPDGQTRINVKIKGQVETELNGRGPDIPPRFMEALFARLNTLNAGDTLVLSGSVPVSLPAHTYGDILSRMAGISVRCVVDAAGELLHSCLPYRPFLVKPNHQELGELLEKKLSPDDLPALTAAAQQLQRQGAKNVMVSLGKYGALLAAADGKVYVQRPPTGQLKNSVGAGDATVAGFLAACGEGYAQALRLAVAAGSATAFSLTLATKAEIDAAYRQLT